MKYAIINRLGVLAFPKCGARDAEYIAIRRLTASAVARTINVGAFSVINCTAANWAVPAMTITENPMVWARLNPASVATTPNSIPKGKATTRNGNPLRKPVRKYPCSEVADIWLLLAYLCLGAI